GVLCYFILKAYNLESTSSRVSTLTFGMSSCESAYSTSCYYHLPSLNFTIRKFKNFVALQTAHGGGAVVIRQNKRKLGYPANSLQSLLSQSRSRLRIHHVPVDFVDRPTQCRSLLAIVGPPQIYDATPITESLTAAPCSRSTAIRLNLSIVAAHECGSLISVAETLVWVFRLREETIKRDDGKRFVSIESMFLQFSLFFMMGGTKFTLNDALFSPKSTKNLLSFKDIQMNGYHVETMNKGRVEYLCITSYNTGNKCVLERLPILSSGLYYTQINMIEAYAATNSKMNEMFKLWHDRLGHPGSIMMRRIIETSSGHPLKNQRILQIHELTCASCSQWKLIMRPSHTKVGHEAPLFLERIHGEICGPIHPPCGPFRYFMVLIDASSRWSHVSLLSTRNVVFAKLLAQLIKLRAQFPDYIIKRVRLNNAGEFTSQAFNDYYMAVRIDVEHLVAHVHTQNGLAESLIKRLQLIARPLIMRTKLHTSVWGHAILHTDDLIRIRPGAHHTYSLLQLAYGREPNIAHIRVFGCVVYVPIAPPQRTKMGPQRRLGIYVGYESPSIIKYLEPKTGDVFTARFDDCHFNEELFPTLGGNERSIERNIEWKTSSLSYLDPPTKKIEQE
ncbi:Unknown protein, partial [Striga hermonthica]